MSEIVIYQLFATAPESINGWKFRVFSKKIFESKLSAENHIEDFKKLCSDPNQFDYAEYKDISVEIRERILVKSP